MVSFLGEDLDFKVQGYVSLPKLTRASRNYISLLINGRYIKNKQLLKAVLKGYGSKLMVGRYPFGVIDIHLDPLLVDVNVVKKEDICLRSPILPRKIALVVFIYLMLEIYCSLF